MIQISIQSISGFLHPTIVDQESTTTTSTASPSNLPNTLAPFRFNVYFHLSIIQFKQLVVVWTFVWTPVRPMFPVWDWLAWLVGMSCMRVYIFMYVVVIHRPLGCNLPTLTAVFVKMRLRIRYKIGDVFMLVHIMLVSLFSWLGFNKWWCLLHL